MEHKNTEEIRKAEIPQFLFRVAEFMKSRTEWVGTATDLIADMAETETTPNVVTKYLTSVQSLCFAERSARCAWRKYRQSSSRQELFLPACSRPSARLLRL